MAKEIITPKGVTANAGKTVTMRFTDIWMKDKKAGDLLQGRQPLYWFCRIWFRQ